MRHYKRIGVLTVLKTSLVGLLLVLVTACGKGEKQSYINDQYRSFPSQDLSEIQPFSSFVLATFAEMENEEQRAASFYKEAIKQDPNNLFVAEKAFLQLITSGMLEEASSLNATLNESDFLGPLSHLMMAVEAMKNKDAETLLLEAKIIENTSFGYIFSPFMQAWGFAMQGDVTRAHDALDLLGESKALKGLALTQKAYIYDYLGMGENAEMAYKAVLSSGTMGSVQPIISYADFLSRQKGSIATQDVFVKALKDNGNNLYLLRESQRIANGLNPSIKAATPDGALAHLFYRMALETMRESPNLLTIIYARIAEYFIPQNDDFKLLLGDVFVRFNRFEDAAKNYNMIAENSPLKNPTFIKMINALRSAGLHEEAIDHMNKELLKAPNNKNLHLTLADIYRENNQCAEALPHYNKVINVQISSAETSAYEYFSRGVCHEVLGNWEEAKIDLYKAKSITPEDPIVLNYLGYSLLIRNESLQEALAMIEVAAEKEPENGSIIDSLGWLQYRTGDLDSALISLEKAVRLSPENPTINDHLGDVYWQVGRKREARFQWQHALVLATEMPDQIRIKNKLAYGLQADDLPPSDMVGS